MTNKRKEATKTALLDAMVLLLNKESFDDITTIELAKTAGVSRSSFYTHYKDKYEMIDSYQQMLFHKLEYIFEREYESREQAFLEVFHFLEREQLLSALISANGTKELQNFIINKVRILLSSELKDRLGTAGMSKIEIDYQSIYLAYAFFGTCQTWIARGKKETPREMTNFVLKMLDKSAR
ncbi:TetR/AcrR family transcriptional regulator [Streptococcus halichoeri]|uniref:TetR/AcrR family transcriptional regulator n=1 Tax=Streptococcus halichoeri TaxID=254785 RepID=UPI000DB33B1F|nr:TetR/AcrR family transcriptional regulator [Streptococcus halichoeri]PZO93834.1 MAG: TetR family transcriptional regulator [Streptococcus pyogenes]